MTLAYLLLSQVWLMLSVALAEFDLVGSAFCCVVSIFWGVAAVVSMFHRDA